MVVMSKESRFCKILLGSKGDPSDLYASCFGDVKVATQEEIWPVYDGLPMVPIFQINIKELPYIPSVLKGFTFLTYFFRATGFEQGALNGQGWVLRAYTKNDRLVPLKAPSFPPIHDKWGLLQKHFLKFEEALETKSEPVFCSKFGGFMSPLQDKSSFTEEQLFPEDIQILDSKQYVKSDYFEVIQKKEPEIPMSDFWKSRGWDKLKKPEKEVKSTFAFQLDSETFVAETGWYFYDTQGMVYFFRGRDRAVKLWYSEIQFL